MQATLGPKWFSHYVWSSCFDSRTNLSQGSSFIASRRRCCFRLSCFGGFLPRILRISSRSGALKRRMRRPKLFTDKSMHPSFEKAGIHLETDKRGNEIRNVNMNRLPTSGNLVEYRKMVARTNPKCCLDSAPTSSRRHAGTGAAKGVANQISNTNGHALGPDPALEEPGVVLVQASVLYNSVFLLEPLCVYLLRTLWRRKDPCFRDLGSRLHG